MVYIDQSNANITLIAKPVSYVKMQIFKYLSKTFEQLISVMMSHIWGIYLHIDKSVVRTLFNN